MINKLEWDSVFFSCEIGKKIINSREDINSFYLDAKQYDMVYVISEIPLNINAKLVDIKHTYIKKTNHGIIDLSSKHTIENFQSNQHDYNKLLELVYLSGHESRFLKDPFFGKENFKRLYKTWIDKNINEYNNFVLVYMIEDEMVGFVSYAIKEEKASIELIAVDNSHQGFGIGKKLMKTVENSTPINFKFTVPTQESNSIACKFYLKYGFVLEQRQYIYHYVDKRERS